jgi:YD repeat-containing protein
MDRTTWSYDLATGLLTNKVYADNNGTAYTYTPDGKLETRTWARGVTTTYAYDAATGSMTNIDYSAAATADISFTYDRLGRRTTITDAAGTWTFQYDPDTLALTNEVLVTLDGITNALTRSQDALGRPEGFSLITDNSITDHSVSYAYDSLDRPLRLRRLDQFNR